MIILIQYLFKYVLFEKFDLLVALNELHFALLTLSTVCIAIAGYIINDINDVKADIVNKPDRLFIDRKIVRSTAQYLFYGFNTLGLGLGMYLSYYIGHTSYFFIYVLTAFLLYKYANYFKFKFLIGNIIISLIILLSIVLVLLFDLMPVTSNYNLSSQMTVLKILVIFGIYGFFFTFLREVVKDIEDIEGDKAMESRTLPIVLGIPKTKTIVIIIASLILLSLALGAYMLYAHNLYLSIYLLIAVALPLLYFILKITKADSKNQFNQMSTLLKIIMFTGILSMIFI
jgi:4-hydroxybenzoate polyprenyltransferase